MFRILLLLLALLPTAAGAAMHTLQAKHFIPEGTDNFEIVIAGDITPLSALAPEGSSWNWASTYDSFQQATTIKFHGENFTPQDCYAVFGVEFSSVDKVSINGLYWSRGEELFPVNASQDSIDYSFDKHVAKATVRNPSATNPLNLIDLRWLSREDPVPLPDLNLDGTPPELFNYVIGNPPTLLPGESWSFEFPLPDSHYALLYMATEYGTPGLRGARDEVTIHYTQLRSSEMYTPTAAESWSEIKQKYE